MQFKENTPSTDPMGPLVYLVANYLQINVFIGQCPRMRASAFRVGLATLSSIIEK